MEYTLLNPFIPNASVFRRPDGVFEIYLHLPGIISDLEVTPFANYLLVSGRHFLPGFKGEDGREADLIWSDQPCGYFGRDIPLGMDNATEPIMLESSCQDNHVVRVSIRPKGVFTASCGEVMQGGELPVAMSNEQAVEVPQNPVSYAPVYGNTSANHGASQSQFWTDLDNRHSLPKPVLLQTDQTSVPEEVVTDGGIVAHSEGIFTSTIQDTTHSLNASLDHPDARPSSHNFEIISSNVNNSGDPPREQPSLISSGEILTLPAQNAAVAELVRQEITKHSADGESGNAQNDRPDITKDGPSGSTLAGASHVKVPASSSHLESGSVPVNVPNSLQGRPENGGQQPSDSTGESPEHRVEFSADHDTLKDPSMPDSAPAAAMDNTHESSQSIVTSAPQTIRGPTEVGNGTVSMQPNAGGPSRISEPPRETHAVDSTSNPAPQNPLNSSETALHDLATEKEDGNVAIKDPVIVTESCVDQGSATTAPPKEVDAPPPRRDPNHKLPATSHSGLGSDTWTTENNVAVPSAEEGDAAVSVHEDESPLDEPTDSTDSMDISTESLENGLVNVSKKHGDGYIDTTPRQTPEESDSVARPSENVPNPATTSLTYAQVAKKSRVDRPSRGKSGSPQSSYEFVTNTPDVSTPDDHNLSPFAEPPTKPPSDKLTEKAEESTYYFVSPDSSTAADRISPTPTHRHSSKRLPSGKSTGKADCTFTSICECLRDVFAGDAVGQSSDLVPSDPLSLDKRGPATRQLSLQFDAERWKVEDRI